MEQPTGREPVQTGGPWIDRVSVPWAGDGNGWMDGGRDTRTFRAGGPGRPPCKFQLLPLPLLLLLLLQEQPQAASTIPSLSIPSLQSIHPLLPSSRPVSPPISISYPSRAGSNSDDLHCWVSDLDWSWRGERGGWSSMADGPCHWRVTVPERLKWGALAVLRRRPTAPGTVVGLAGLAGNPDAPRQGWPPSAVPLEQ